MLRVFFILSKRGCGTTQSTPCSLNVFFATGSILDGSSICPGYFRLCASVRSGTCGGRLRLGIAENPAGRAAAKAFLDGFGLGGLKLVRNRGELVGL